MCSDEKLKFSESERIVALEITERVLEGVYVLVLRGRLVLREESSRFRTTVDTLLSKGATRIVVSLYGVKSIDTSGLGSLIDALQGSKAGGGLLKLASPSPRLMQVLQSSNLQGYFRPKRPRFKASGRIAEFTALIKDCHLALCVRRGWPDVPDGIHEIRRQIQTIAKLSGTER